MSIVIQAVIVAFVGGLVVGVTWRESVELLLGRDDPQMMVNRTRATARAVFGHRTTIATWAVVLAMLVGGILGIVVAFTHSDASRAVSGVRTLSEKNHTQIACQRRYNHQSGLARKDRAKAGARALRHQIDIAEADIHVWIGIRHLLTTTHGTLHEALTVIDHRIGKGRTFLDSLMHQQHVQKLNHYPPANLCTRKGTDQR